ncbi:MAG: twin-arginine translocase subunit TatC [Bacteroidales bacterium]|nr:twin-arginine translocase subunit TatC [Bacteroidales bacterium]
MHEEVTNKKKHKKSPEKEMSFWEHLEELRWHLFRSIFAILMFSIVAFLNKGFIFDRIILAPKEEGFITNVLLCRLGEWLSVKALCMGNLNLSLQNISMSGQFLTHLYVSLMAGLVIAAPYIIWEIWRFVVPALKPGEKKHSRGAVFYISFLFVAGILFSYFLIVPLAINFLGTYQISPDVPNQIQLSSYISTVVSVTLAVGIVFELPVFVYFLTKIGVLTPSFMRKNRKIMVVAVLTLSAIITPPDIFSQVLVTIPLVALYELSIRISDRIYREKQEALAG